MVRRPVAQSLIEGLPAGCMGPVPSAYGAAPQACTG